MTSKKTGYLLGAVAGVGIMAAAVAGAAIDRPGQHADGQAHLIKASTAPIFAPPPGAPMSFADIFDRVSPAVVSINVTSRVDASALRKIPGFETSPSTSCRAAARAAGTTMTPRRRRAGERSVASRGCRRSSPQDPDSSSRRTATSSPTARGRERRDHQGLVLKDETSDLMRSSSAETRDTDPCGHQGQGSNVSGFPFVDLENAAKPRVGDWVIAVGQPLRPGRHCDRRDHLSLWTRYRRDLR